ncbi:VWA domain-containing protein [Halobaculum sp. MBLA0147]|uniref:vWA domain-containing protein n=1 Tax=Halobaculum sp. MBLA0147 TaxID=3079934 RepID=UPI0035231220
MTDDTQTDGRIALSRRNVLAGLGTIGAASAGAGLGTSAYFSDTEEFTGNSLTAGSLDLKVDWEEHYSDWSDDEAEGLEFPVLMDPPGDGDPDVPYVGLPDPENPLIYVAQSDLATFMDNTSVEAYPDPDDDGVQNAPEEYVVCEDGADTPDDLDPTADGALRTLNADTYDQETETAKPLVAIDDVKPGDFGEATLSFHLCDNPGYVWLQGELDEELTGENGVTEPEADDPDEEEGVVELLDEIQTTWWYEDDGDNVIDQGAGETPCVEFVLDASGSMSNTDGDGVSRNQEAIDGAKQLAAEIVGAGGRVGVTFFSASGYDSGAQNQLSLADPGSSDLATVESTIESLPANGGSTAIGEGIETGDEDLQNCDADERGIQVVVTDGGNNAGTDPGDAADDVTGGDSDDYTDEIFAIGTGGSSEAALLDFARPADDVHAEFTTDLTAVIANLSQVILGEKVIFRGSLREALGALSSGNGIPLDGNRATAFDEFADGADAEGRECYLPEITHYVGFAWYLPVDHANEVQTDSVGFDLGFYTEQCRHNDGSGMEPEETAATTPS